MNFENTYQLKKLFREPHQKFFPFSSLLLVDFRLCFSAIGRLSLVYTQYAGFWTRCQNRRCRVFEEGLQNDC